MQQSFQIQAYPFRMTPANLAHHRTNPHMAFWKMLKVGNDHFEATHLEPKVEVCNRRYVFDAQQPPNWSKPIVFDPTGKCPARRERAVGETSMQDDTDFTEFVTFTVAGQTFGLPISRVQDVFKPSRITRVPLAGAEIAGVLNLRGRIVTAIDMRRRLEVTRSARSRRR
jgi:murein L,D-transpeptidase YafK